MTKTLIIVESPAKANKIQEYLGKNYVVMASKGHITDLAKGGRLGLGVDVEKDFKPHYVLMEDKVDVLDSLMAAAKKVDQIFVASDMDREGESIAWHLSQRLADIGKPIKRMVFNEIKRSKIQQAIKDVREIDMNLFHSQEARRILDRLVGFTASPFLMNFFGPKLSAGRVQSVVTRMVIDREREIESFMPEDYWTIHISLTDGNDNFQAKYQNKITDQLTADATKISLFSKDYVIGEVKAEEEKKFPSAPLVTSTLQRIMSKKHGFDAARTMKAAQSLYESGFCTYIRTDSVRTSDETLSEVRQWLTDNQFALPKKPNTYKNRDTIQDAHECIRPSDLNLDPRTQTEVTNPDEKLVYNMIWRCFIASQMMPALYDTLVVLASPSNAPQYQVKASGKALKYKGFMEILGLEDNSSIDIPNLTPGQIVQLQGQPKVEHKQTQPPPRYSEDKLIKELEIRNIGRPATYAELLSKITTRNYVEKKGNVFHATELGKQITDELNKYFTFMNYDYTAAMERQLDEIESGKVDHVTMLKKFYPEYKKQLDLAYTQHGASLCDQCGHPMVIRTAKVDGSKFLACTNYPRCKRTQNLSSGVLQQERTSV